MFSFFLFKEGDVSFLHYVSIFKDNLVLVKKWSILILRKMIILVRTSAWVNRKLRTWKWGQATKKEQKNTVWACRDGVRKANALLHLKLARVIKGNKNFYHCTKVKGEQEKCGAISVYGGSFSDSRWRWGDAFWALMFRGYTYKLSRGKCCIHLQKRQENGDLLTIQPHFCPWKIPKHIPHKTF